MYDGCFTLFVNASKCINFAVAGQLAEVKSEKVLLSVKQKPAIKLPIR